MAAVQFGWTTASSQDTGRPFCGHRKCSCPSRSPTARRWTSGVTAHPPAVLPTVSTHFSSPLQTQFVSAFKQSPRREDDISTVTAAMSATFAPGTDIVEELRLSYGGMAATTVLAKKTANRLLGR